MLFGTDFDMLDSSQGRNQTTKGIHLGVNKDCKSLIIDIEGTDSQVRGDDGAAFEHMSALFALACSDVLMVNMWTSEIGRYKAASVGLLKTIFEVNLRLFTLEKKKRILFVMRDFNDQQNNISILKQQMSKTLEELWSKIKKPDSYMLLSVFDCFDFEFKTIAVKDFKPEEFKNDIDDLRERFMITDRMDYLFRQKETDIPLDGIPLYFQEIWTVIGNDKDLNIPSQKEMLANLRCNEIKYEAVQKFTSAIDQLRKQVGRTVVQEFAYEFNGHIENALKEYDKQASAYFETIYLTIRTELYQLLLDQIKDLFNSQMRVVVSDCIGSFKDLVSARLNKSLATEGFNEILNDSTVQTFLLFETSSTNSLIDNSGWTVDEYRGELVKAIQEKREAEREKQIAYLEKEVKSALSGKFSTAANKIIENAHEEDMWVKLREFQAENMRDLESRTRSILSGLDYTSDAIEDYIKTVRQDCFTTLKSKASKFCSNLVDQLVKRFNQLFLKDERGIPRE